MKLTFMINVDMGPGVDDGSLDEPRQTEAHQDIKHVGSDSIGYRHVTVTVNVCHNSNKNYV